MTAVKAADWLSELALRGEHSAATLRTYRSALSTAWEESGAEGPNPLQSHLVERVIRGASKLLLPRDIAAKSAHDVTVELTPMLLAHFYPFAREAARATHGLASPGPLPVMMWAAACLGVFGLLRPNEFLYVGASQKTVLPGTAIIFRSAPGHQAEAAMLPRGSIIEHDNCPDRFDVDLGATKADHLAQNGRLVIASRMCVMALWRWMHVRRDAGYLPQEPLFVWTRVGERIALSSRRLLEWVGILYTRLTGVRPKLTGRAFRRGGASAMLQNGATIPEIMAAGRWKSPAMVGVYASNEAQRNRAAAASRALDPTPWISLPAAAREW